MSPDSASAIKALGNTVLAAGSGLVFGNFLINLLLQGSLQQLFSTIKKMQILVHMALVNVSLPANASMFFAYLLQIVAFDVVPTDNAYDTIFSFEESKPVTTNFELMGYESVYAIRNLGSMFLIFILAAMAGAFLAISSISKSAKVHEYRGMVKERLFWNGILSFLNETYIILCVSFMLNLQVLWDPETPKSHGGTIFSLIIGITIGIVLIALPIFIAIYFPMNKDKILECDYEFKQKFGTVFEELNVKRHGSAVFALPVYTMARSFILSSTVVFLPQYSNF